MDTETKNYSDGSSATGPAPLPDMSPMQQTAAIASLMTRADAALAAAGAAPVAAASSIAPPGVMTGAQHDAAELEHVPPAGADAQEPEHAVPLARMDGVHSNIIELMHAQALPLAEVGEHVSLAVIAHASIEHFMDEVTDEAGVVHRFLSRIVVNAEGKLRKLRLDVTE